MNWFTKSDKKETDTDVLAVQKAVERDVMIDSMMRGNITAADIEIRREAADKEMAKHMSSMAMGDYRMFTPTAATGTGGRLTMGTMSPSLAEIHGLDSLQLEKLAFELKKRDMELEDLLMALNEADNVERQLKEEEEGMFVRKDCLVLHTEQDYVKRCTIVQLLDVTKGEEDRILKHIEIPF